MRRLPCSCVQLRSMAVAFVIVIGSVGLAHGAPVTWVGPNGSFWDLSANWDPSLPGATSEALLGAFDTEFRSGTVTGSHSPAPGS